MPYDDRPLVKYEKLICSGPQVEFVKVVMPERRERLVDDSEEAKREKRERRREEKALINAGLEEPDPDRIAPSLSRTRSEIRRIVMTNAWQYLDANGKPIVPKFLTLTFKENIRNLQEAVAELKKFVRRFNAAFDDVLLEPLKYLCVPEFQERGAVHYHMILFNLPFLGKEEFSRIRELWPDRFELKGIAKTNDTQKVIGYVSKYVSKQTADGRFFGQKRYFCSRDLKLRITLKEAEAIATLRRDYLPPFKVRDDMIHPDYMEYLYYEIYYLGDRATILSLPLDESTRHALELAQAGTKVSPRVVPQEALPLPQKNPAASRQSRLIPTPQFSMDIGKKKHRGTKKKIS